MNFPTFPTWPARTAGQPRRRHQRGAVLTSPVVLLSVVAVALAAIAFVVTRSDAPAERDISASKAAAEPSSSAPASTPSGSGTPSAAPSSSAPPKPTPKPVVRADHSVVVFNNTQIKGLAGRVSATVEKAGWKVAGADNWYGTVPATTVYFPKGQRAVARQLALDLGVSRVRPADTGGAMSSTNLTLILTGEL